MLSTFLILLMLCLAGLIPGMVQMAAALDGDTMAQLQTAKEIYLSTKRKSGEWGSAAPVWFWYADGVIYLTASPSSYKARRILGGREHRAYRRRGARRSDLYRQSRDFYGRGYRRTHG